jgi:hypothetical protein
MVILKNKKFLTALFIIGAFFLAIIVWYSPIIFKGYTVHEMSAEIILARNYYQTGVFANQNDLNVILSPSLIKENGHPLVMNEYLGSFFYSQIFKLFGTLSYNNVVLLSVILYAIVFLIFALLILRLFGSKIAMIFSLIYIFLPFSWGITYYLGIYEFCLLFLALFFVFYFWAEKKEGAWSIVLFIISGTFLAVSALSKEVTLVFALALFIYLFFKKRKKELLAIFIPFICLLIIFWLPSIIGGENRYISLVKTNVDKSVFSTYLHVFPDPHTYYFEKEQFLSKIKNQDLGMTENLETQKILANFGLDKITIFNRLKIGTYLLIKHIFRFFSLQEFGGPFILLLMIIGLLCLRKRLEKFYGLLKYWVVLSFLIFSYILFIGRGHLMDFIFPFSLTITLGILFTADLFKEKFKFSEKKTAAFLILITGFIVYHLILINHVVLGDKYDRDYVPRSMAYAELINKSNIQDVDVIAVPGSFPAQLLTLNYLTEKSFVLFSPETVEKLYTENKLKKALETFNVKYVLDYSDTISKKLVEQGKAINISSNSLEINTQKISENKSFFMNLIR